MGPKKQGKKGGRVEDDFDFDAILAEEAKKNAALLPAAPAAAEVAPTPPATPAQGDGDDNDDDDDDDDAPGASAGGAKSKMDKLKEKKKLKKKEKKKEEAKPKELSAAAKAILLRKQQQEEEEARIKKLQEEEEARIRAEEEAEAKRLKEIEDEKERKRKAKQDKIEAQKAAGTYLTKAQKEAKRRQEEKLAAMKAAGMVPVAALEGGANGGGGGAAAMYGKKKPVKTEKTESKGGAADAQKEKEEPQQPQQQEQQKQEESESESEEEPEDDWENADFDLVSTKIGTKVDVVVKSGMEIDENDTAAVAEAEENRKRGLMLMEREKEAAAKRAAEEAEREEMDRAAREEAIRKERSREGRAKREEEAKKLRSKDNLRSPISCIMGHVDTGKTKLLDKIRHTNVQEGEAGGITQQIGATQFSRETLALQTKCLQAKYPFDIKLPGLLVIDTPGHESFSNLRSRGSSLCDIAILVIDLMHGLEQTTRESIQMLKMKRTPFVVALNKVDRLYGWKTMPDCPIQDALAAQDENCKLEFKDRLDQAILQLNEVGLNAKLYWENDSLGDTVSVVPTSAVSGEGVPDLLKMLITLTQERLTEQLMYHEALQCTVLEVKVIEGLGTTVDVVLVNGTLREGDTIVVSTMDGPVSTTIRALLTPPPNREMRVKSEYVHHEMIKGAIGVKIVATDIARAVAGTPIEVVYPEDDLEQVKEDVQSDVTKLMKALETDNLGVMVHASTLGALEALLQFLREECKPPIPVSHINIGPIYKKDIMRANIMNEKNHQEFATILAFDVKVDAEAAQMAEELKVRIFTAEIIYHLFDQFSAYMNGIQAERRAAAEAIATFPCMLKIMPQHIFNKKDPIILGVEVTEGTLRLGTLVCVPSLNLDVGKITSIENNHREVPSAKKGTSVAIRITNEANPTITYGRQFDHNHVLVSRITRESIDALKQFFREEMTNADWLLIQKLMPVFNIKSSGGGGGSSSNAASSAAAPASGAKAGGAAASSANAKPGASSNAKPNQGRK